MKKYVDGKYIEMTAEELAEIQTPSIPFEQRVVDRIRAVYSIDDELAILRQRDSKPEEFTEYNTFVEKVKTEEKWKLV